MPPARPGLPLIDRELDLLRRLASGQPHHEIAPSLFLTVSGVQSMANRMVGRLGARNIAHAVHLAHEYGLLDPEPSVCLSEPLVQVLALVADGHTNAEIARALGRSEHTVADQVKEARRRLGARDRAHAAALAVAMRIVRVEVPSTSPLADAA